MSSTLMWRPVKKPSGAMCNRLKRAVGSYKFGGDGSCWSGSVIMDNNDIGFLEGLQHVGIADAEKLQKLIYRHGQIELFLE